MKKVKITLVLGDKVVGQPGTHTYYEIWANDKKIGELIHRHSKDTYTVNWDLPMLSSEHFRTLVPFFSEYLVEEAFTEEFNKLIESL